MLYLTLISLGALLVVSVGAGLLVKALFDERGRAEAVWARERQTLLQRVQAPQQAVIDHSVALAPAPTMGPVPFDDDEAFWESKEDMAAKLDETEA